MMNRRLYTLGALFFLALIGVFFIARISAQKANTGLTVYPTNFDLTANPGESHTEKVTLQNQTDQTVKISATGYNFTAQGEEGAVSLTKDSTNYSLASWTTILPKTATIPAHQSQEFTFTIAVPLAAEHGGHFGSIVFQTIPDADIKGTGAILSQRLASLILFTVPGDVSERAEAETLTTDKSFYEFGPVNLLLRVRNSGNVHITPTGVIVVTGMLGQRYEIPLDQYNVLPQSVRQISAVLHKKFLLGKYSAYLIVSYGQKNQPLYAMTDFYVFPWRYGLIVLGVLMFLFLLRKRLFKAIRLLVTGK